MFDELYVILNHFQGSVRNSPTPRGVHLGIPLGDPSRAPLEGSPREIPRGDALGDPLGNPLAASGSPGR